MNLFLLFLQLGPLPSPPSPGGGDLKDFRWISEEIPLLIAGIIALAMLFSLLFRYSERFREFWAKHICAFMEEHREKEEM